MDGWMLWLWSVVAVAGVLLALAVRVVQQYEKGVQFRLGRLHGVREPGLRLVVPYALGGGCELAMACDIRIAARTARFGLPETALSVLPGAGGTQRMARLVGVGRAIDLILTGELLDADDALATGLVTRVVEPEVLLETAHEVARSILRKGPLAVRLAKVVVRTGMDADRRTGLVVEQLAQTLLYTTDDKREGAAAFLAKRTPKWSGR